VPTEAADEGRWWGASSFSSGGPSLLSVIVPGITYTCLIVLHIGSVTNLEVLKACVGHCHVQECWLPILLPV
jgi:hypothetical protein